MLISIIIALLASLSFLQSEFGAQDFNVQTQAQEIVTTLNNVKDKVVEKFGARCEAKEKVKNEPTAQNNLPGYSRENEIHLLGLTLKSDVELNKNTKA